MLDDAEMLGRLEHLYGPGRAEAIGREWEALRGRGLGHLVDEAKERYCRRMYEKMLGRPWEEVRATLESMYADKLPDSRGGGQTPRFYFNLHLLRLEAPPLSSVCDSDVIFGLLFRVVRHLVP